MVIGLTGGSGSGKTTALEVLRALGAVCFDADAVYHGLLRTDRALLAAIEAAFPGTVTEGTLDRKALGRRVFGDAAALRRLTDLTQPRVAEVIRAQLRPGALAVIDAIGLLESGLARLCDCTVAVTAPAEARVARLMAREGISADYARARIAAQRSDAEFAAECDYTLHNDGDLLEFRRTCEKFFEKIIKKGERNMENLMYAPKNGFDRLTETDRAEMEAYCRRYMDFMDRAKTEREAAVETIRIAEEHGFKEFKAGMALKAGDRVYANNRGKSVIFAVIGKEPLSEGCHITAAHADSPRLDLKPSPLTEDSELAYLKTHYYGGIKKYQWTTVPLAIHGVVTTEDGTVHRVTIGEDENDPIFCVTDLLVHLSADQMKKTMADGVTGENLRIIVGSEPLSGEGTDRVKKHVMTLLHEKYGIVEEDLLSAELTMVPAGKSREVGLDRSLIAAYGHDDRVCAYAEFEPLLDLETPTYTAVCILADKEEIGSVGVSGMQSQYFEYFLEDLCDIQGVKLRHCLAASTCLSADVSNAYDPLYAETCDKQNNSQLNYGITLCKYTGARGKGGASDASSELFNEIRSLFNREGVIWQTGELGKVDQGGGGTVACYMANRNIDTLDAGVPVLSMHAPMELVSKLDTYMTRKAMQVFYLAK